MDNKIEVFKNEQFGEVRTILEGETLLFCGSDIAKALGYARPGKAIIDHCKGVLKRDTLTSGGMQSLSYIPEGDVYRLIVHSKLPAAEKFEHWLFELLSSREFAENNQSVNIALRYIGKGLHTTACKGVPF